MTSDGQRYMYPYAKLGFRQPGIRELECFFENTISLWL